MRYRLVPISLRQAYDFTSQFHRHNVGSKAHKFSIGLEKDGELVGCATVGRPVSRVMDDGRTAEVLRVCVKPGNNRNANSMLYGACVRAAKAMGYDSVITYTLVSESGASPSAAGFVKECEVRGRPNGWDTKSRPRKMPDVYPKEDKIRWRHR